LPPTPSVSGVPRARALPLLTLALVVTAGCVGSPLAGSSSPTGDSPRSPQPTTADTPLPGDPVTFPDGPKERPERPATLNESSVREYARTFEYRIAYNSLWYGEGSDVELECSVESVSARTDGYEAVVDCYGYSNTRGTVANSTATGTTLHADWGSQSFRYRVSANATTRVRADR
jgi:hypothetical protein